MFKNFKREFSVMAGESVPKFGNFFLTQKGDPDWRKSLWNRLKFNPRKGILSEINYINWDHGLIPARRGLVELVDYS